MLHEERSSDRANQPIPGNGGIPIKGMRLTQSGSNSGDRYRVHISVQCFQAGRADAS